MPEWLCTWAILGVKVTTFKSIVFPAKDRPAGRTLFVREFWRTHVLQSSTPSWFSIFLWVFCTCTREWRWRRSWRRYHFEVYWGSPMWPSKLYFSTEIFKNVLKILYSMGIKFTLEFEIYLTGNCAIFAIRGSYMCTHLRMMSYEDHAHGSQKWIWIQIEYCSWSEDKYLWTKKPARGT